MSLFQRSRERSESSENQRPDAGGLSVTVADDQSSDGGGSIARSPLFRVGHLLLGGLLAFMAVDNLRNLEERVGYAEAKGAPMASLSVPAISSSLLVGSIGLALWRAPTAAASAVVAFFVSTTPVMHDFWSVEDPEQRQQEMFHFLKNAAILSATLAFLGLGRQEDRAGGTRGDRER